MQIHRVHTLAAITLLGAQATAAQVTAEIEYKHYSECKLVSPRQPGCNAARTVHVDPGGRIILTIKETRAKQYKITAKGFVKEPEKDVKIQGEAMLAALAPQPVDVEVAEIVHDVRYGGYVVSIVPLDSTIADGTPVPKTDGTTKVPGAAEISITVVEKPDVWRISGGINFTGLRSSQFVARQVSGRSEYEVASEHARRDDATIGLATFVNFQLWRWLWPGVGIGIESDGDPNYYFGLGYHKLGGVFINSGVVLGPVATLPAGLRVGDRITDPNRLTTLGTRRQLSWFLGVSFPFLGRGKAALEKPFALPEAK